MRERRCQRWPRKAAYDAALRGSEVLLVGSTPEILRLSALAPQGGGNA